MEGIVEAVNIDGIAHLWSNLFSIVRYFGLFIHLFFSQELRAERIRWPVGFLFFSHVILTNFSYTFFFNRRGVMKRHVSLEIFFP